MKYIFLLFCFCYINYGNAQTNKEIDSLLKALDTEKQDSNILKTVARIGSFYIDNNPSKAIEYFERAILLAKKTNAPLRLANSHYDLGFCYLLKGDFDKALDHYQQSASLYESLKDNRRLANAYMSIGNLFFQNKNLTKSSTYYDKAEFIVIQSKDSNQLCTIYSERGMVYDQTGQYDSALLHLQMALDLARRLGDDYMITNSLSNIGLTYKHKKNTALALQYFDTVLYRYQTLQEPPLDNLAALYNNLGATQAQAGNYKKALEAFNRSIDFANRISIPGIVMENYRNMSDMYADMKDYKLQSEYLKKYYQLKDSVFNIDSRNQLTQLEADYQLEKKNISLVKEQAETIKQKNQRNLFLILSVAAVLLLLTLGIFYRRSKQSNFLLEQKNEQINLQKNQLLTLNQVKDRLFSIISHDLRNPLVTLKSYLSLSESAAIAPEKKEKFKKQTQQAVSQTSIMLDNLLVWANMQIKNAVPTITSIQLEDCIDDAIGVARAQADQKQIQLNKSLEVYSALADHNILEIALRNIITNAVKYSNPNGVVQITTKAAVDKCQITVRDEGVGMSAEQINAVLANENNSTPGTEGEKGSGLGLFLAKELLQKMNASLSIESELGKGTSCIILLNA